MYLLMQAYHKMVLMKGWAKIILNRVTMLITDFQPTSSTTKIDFFLLILREENLKVSIDFLFLLHRTRNTRHVTPDTGHLWGNHAHTNKNVP